MLRLRKYVAQSGSNSHFVFAVGVAAFCSMESWILGPLSWIYGYGGGLETIPAYLALSSNGRNFSSWAPFIAGGIDRVAFWGNADPLSFEILLFSLLPVWLANGFHRFLQYFVAVFFAARVGKEQLGLNYRWAGFLGLLHAAFAYQTTGALFTIAGVPLLVWILDRLTEDKRSWTGAIVAGLAFSLLTTFTFSDPYLLLFGAMWLILVQRRYSWHAARQFLLFSVSLLVADSPQLLAVAANAPFSHRANWPGEQIGWSLDGLFYRQLQFDIFSQDKLLEPITLNLPGLTLLSGVPIALYAFWRKSAAATSVAIFFRIVLVWAILSQKWFWVTLQAAIQLILPFVSGVYMGRFFQIPAAFVIACGMTMVFRLVWDLLPGRIMRRCAAAAAIGFAIFMIMEPKRFLFYPLGVEDWGERNYEIAALDDIRAKETAPFRVASVLPLQPAYAYAQGFETPDGWANLFPAVYRDLWLRVMTPLFAELPFTKKIFGVDKDRPEDNFIFLGADLIEPGVGALPGEDPREALKTGFDIDRRFNLNILRLLNVKYLLSEYPLKSPGIELVHAPLVWPDFPQSRSRNTGLMHSTRRPEVNESGGLFKYSQPFSDIWAAWKRRKRGKDIFVYAVKDALPRFRFVNQVSIEPSGSAVLDHLAKMNANEAVLESSDSAILGENRRFENGSISIVRYTPDEIVLDVVHRGSNLLIIANTWSPYWKAEVDGKVTPLVRVNHAQFGLPIGESGHRVRLYYEPFYSFTSLIGATAKFFK